MPTYHTPSQAIANGACAVCLGSGETHDVVLGRVGTCSGCCGSGLLTDMLRNQCDDPDCPEHGRTSRRAVTLRSV